jgi:hypothetical protein
LIFLPITSWIDSFFGIKTAIYILLLVLKMENEIQVLYNVKVKNKERIYYFTNLPVSICMIGLGNDFSHIKSCGLVVDDKLRLSFLLSGNEGL